MRIFLSAGEASGEQYAMQLMEALRRREPRVEFFGLGGQRMAALGFDRVVRSEDVAVMGITEIVRHIPKIYREYRRLKQCLAQRRPDAAVLIDFPDVNLGLARACRRLSIPVIFFVSPQVWAWKKHRLAQIRRNVDRMLVIFPFEQDYYRERGIEATFVGHPLAELPLPSVGRDEFAQANGLNASAQWIGLLPGSRPKEILLNLPEMLTAAAEIAAEKKTASGPACEFVLPLAPTLNASQVSQIESLIATRTGSKGPLQVRLVRDARAVLFHARASIVASGTATVEAALLGNPFVVVYRVSSLTYAIAKRLVTVPHVAMVNLIAGRRAVPELIQRDFTSANIVRHLLPLLNDDLARQTMQAELRRVGTLLRGHQSAIEQVAAITLTTIETSHLKAAPIIL